MGNLLELINFNAEKVFIVININIKCYSKNVININYTSITILNKNF